MPSPDAAIERCHAEMELCRQYIAAGGERVDLALWGWSDWLMESVLRGDGENGYN